MGHGRLMDSMHTALEQLDNHNGDGTPARRRGLADIHMHTTYSDGLGSVEDVLTHVQERTRLDVIAVTDHNTIEGALRARDLVAAGAYHFEVIVGEEISTNEGHLLALFLQTPIAPHQSIERSIEQVHAQGGLAIVAHPFNKMFRFSVQRSVMDRLLSQPEVHPDGIEVLNGSFAGLGMVRIARQFAQSVYHWAETGSSDAHTPTAVGCAYTSFAGQTSADLRTALLRRETAPAGGFWRLREYATLYKHHYGLRHEAAHVARKALSARKWATAREAVRV